MKETTMTDPNKTPADQAPKNAAETENVEEAIAANAEENDAGLDNYSQDDEGSQAQTIADEAVAVHRRRRDDTGAALGAAATDPGTQAAVQAEQRGYGGDDRRSDDTSDSGDDTGASSDGGGADGGGGD